jgi:hypothetical protein
MMHPCHVDGLLAKKDRRRFTGVLDLPRVDFTAPGSRRVLHARSATPAHKDDGPGFIFKSRPVIFYFLLKNSGNRRA